MFLLVAGACNWVVFKVSSSLNQSMILWFHAYVKDATNTRAGAGIEAEGSNLVQSLKSFLESSFLRQGCSFCHFWNLSMVHIETWLLIELFLFRSSCVYKWNSKNSFLFYFLYHKPKNFLCQWWSCRQEKVRNTMLFTGSSKLIQNTFKAQRKSRGG